jgi:hypothetical protein
LVAIWRKWHVAIELSIILWLLIALIAMFAWRIVHEWLI